MAANLQQSGTLLDVLKKKMRQTKEEMEKYKDECEEFHKKLQAEVMRREEVSFVVAQPRIRRLQVSATQYLRKSATVICQGCVAHSVHGESSLSPISAADESRNRKVMNREEFGETAHNYSDAVVNSPTSVRRTVVFVPSLATSNVKSRK